MTPPIIHFGGEKPRGYTVPVNLTTLKETRLLVQGTSGAGKTTALYGVLQQTYGLVQHIVLDKEGSFPKLREKFDYLLVGGDGEVPIDLSPGAVEVVIRKILETRVNAIIDLSDLVPRDQHEYVRRVAHMMAHLSIKSPLAEHDRLVMIDELQHFGPETGRGTASSTEALIELGSLGRKRGFCLIGATTRVSLVSKSIVEILDNKLIGRCGADDAKRAAEILNFTKADRRDLLSLPTGQFYAYGPAISTDPVLVQSADTLIVLPPRRGERRLTPATPAAVRDVLDAFADIPRESQAEAQTLDELRAQVEDLTKRLRKAEKAATAPVGIKTVEMPVVDPEVVQRAVVAAIQLAERHRRTERTALSENLKRALNDELDRIPLIPIHHALKLEIEGVLAEAVGDRPVMSIQSRRSIPPGEVHIRQGERTVAKIVNVTTAASDGAPVATVEIGRTPLRMLNALRFLESIDVTPASREMLGGLVAVTPSSGTMRDYLSTLRRAGLIADAPNQAVALTDAGRARASDEGLPTTRRELHETWLSKVGKTPRRMLEVLISYWPDSVSRSALGAEVGIDHTSGTMRDYLSTLRRPGLLVDVSAGQAGDIKAADWLFPKGLR